LVGHLGVASTIRARSRPLGVNTQVRTAGRGQPQLTALGLFKDKIDGKAECRARAAVALSES
jgi:hypothetical protein